MIETTLGQALSNLDGFSWQECVYLNPEKIVPSTRCIVIDDNNAELGSDDFTPREAEVRNMKEFLSIQDLEDVISFIQHTVPDPSVELMCKAAAYYFERDAFMPMSSDTDKIS